MTVIQEVSEKSDALKKIYKTPEQLMQGVMAIGLSMLKGGRLSRDAGIEVCARIISSIEMVDGVNVQSKPTINSKWED